ncbi:MULTISPECIES: hypothetical protein [unclassified Cupriavidus]|nr:MULTISPECIES: hypothetical protein [unclassified Cupriavidus]MCA3183838.1 hypothetical protein [Cupriavidus sp.]MCA3189349.1 hypothetical protein [Cupriavidus sp.]MCA3195429.1 hypothetical protein [Cupriavidus sp.]MCA3200984.1 hypothetical protein [Cupriavidus sp.]MCA3233362.1 hypothetical protein [Cupriavidus sp.]
MNKFLTRFFEDDEFYIKVMKRAEWGIIIYSAFTFIAFFVWLYVVRQ